MNGFSRSVDVAMALAWTVFLAAGLTGLSVVDAGGAEADIVAEGAELMKLPGDYKFTEGPAVDREGNVYFTDQPNDRIMKWDASKNSVEEWMKPAGRSNGMYFDASGNLITCADEQNQLWSISPNGEASVLVGDYDGRLFNGPNDLWIHPDGAIYFTDPLYVRPYWKRDPAQEQDGRHVYRLAPGADKAVLVADGFRQPNGIVGTPDGRHLYVADIGAGRTFQFTIMEDGSLQDRKLFCSQGSDGMTLDETGNVYLTGRGVSVYNRDGEKIRQIDVPESWTANVVFGGKDRNLLFIAASDSIYGLKMKVKGASAPRAEAALERLEEREFGQMPDGTSVREFTLRNRGGMEVRLMTLGATLTAIMVPDIDGKPANVIVGSDSLADYLKPFPAASVIGRYANRIGGARFEIDGTSHQLTANNAPNHIHGGRKGFASKVWDAEPLPAAADRAGVRLTCHSDDGEEGYPGKMTASVSYILDDQNRLHLQYEATCDKATIINLTNHAYFNLSGAGGSQFTDHELWIDALSYTEVDRHLIPTGTISPVAGTPLDFSSPKPIGRDMQKVTHPRARIYDHNYVIRRDEDGVTLIARAHESSSGRFLEVWTDQPGVQLFTGNPRGFCLETQNYPDAINHPHFPSPVLRPGEKYLTTTIFAFGSL